MEACGKFFFYQFTPGKTAKVPTIQVTGGPKYYQDVVAE
jgi:hypothetical protein